MFYMLLNVHCNIYIYIYSEHILRNSEEFNLEIFLFLCIFSEISASQLSSVRRIGNVSNELLNCNIVLLFFSNCHRSYPIISQTRQIWVGEFTCGAIANFVWLQDLAGHYWFKLRNVCAEFRQHLLNQRRRSSSFTKFSNTLNRCSDSNCLSSLLASETWFLSLLLLI